MHRRPLPSLIDPHAASSAAAWAAAASSQSATAAAAAPSALSTPSHASRIEFQQLLDLVAKCNGKATEPALERLLPFIKAWLKGHDELAPMGVDCLLSRMRDTSALVRINLLRVADMLFLRSRAWRTALLEHLHAFLSLTVGIGAGAEAHVPKPPARAKELQMLSVTTIRGWNDAFGGQLQLLRLGCDFMQARLAGTHIPSQLEIEQAAATRATLQRQRTQRLLAVRYARLADEFDAQEGELQQLLREIENALELLFPQHSTSDKQTLSDYMLSSTPAEKEAATAVLDAGSLLGSAKPEPEEVPVAKRQKLSDTAEVNTSETAEASSLAAAFAVTVVPSLPAPPEDSRADEEGIEWEDGAAQAAQALPDAASSASSAAAAAAAAAAAVAATDPPVSHSPSPPADVSPRRASAASSASAPVLEGAAAAFGEFQVADAHWWLDEQGHEEAGDAEHEGDEGELVEGEATGDEHKAELERKDGAPPTLQHGLGRNYSLRIEFDANALGNMENADNALLFQTLRDAWARIQKTFLPLLNEWIDTLTRIEFDLSHLRRAASASPSSTSAASAAPTAAAAAVASSRLSALRSQRESFLRRAAEARDRVRVLQLKCSRLGVHVDTRVSERTDAMRSATEREFGVNAAASEGHVHPLASSDRSSIPSSSRTPAGASSSAAATAAATRHASELLRKRAAAETRAVSKIARVKRAHAAEREAQLKAGASGKESGHGAPSADPLRRAFSRSSAEYAPPPASVAAAAAQAAAERAQRVQVKRERL